MINSYIKSLENGKDIKMFVINVFFMQSDILKKITEDVEIAREEDINERIVFGKKGYDSLLIDKKNFSIIKECDGNKRIAFIDGGNSEIIGSTDFSVHLIRIYCCVFQDNKKIDEARNEFFVLVNSSAEGENIFYKTKIYPVKANFGLEDFSISSMDPKIVDGGKRAKISKIGEIARRIGEIRLAEYIIDNNKSDIVVFDGTLECNYGEGIYLEKVFEGALIKNILVCSLAKTTNLFTSSGKNALAYVFRLGGSGIWQYNNIADIEDNDHKADINIVKLNGGSRHCFRFEIFKMQKWSKGSVLGCLANNSRDFSFPGYPYGLITADKFARVSNKEKEYLKSLLLANAGSKIDRLFKEISSNDAHDVLNSIN
jgi:hypothetical protein